MVTFAIRRLDEGVRASLVAHFFALPMRDRCLRFGAALAPEIIAAYVAGIDFVAAMQFLAFTTIGSHSLAWRIWRS
jgi:hypothetical protein